MFCMVLAQLLFLCDPWAYLFLCSHKKLHPTPTDRAHFVVDAHNSPELPISQNGIGGVKSGLQELQWSPGE
jgi:hypothetical protein